MYEMLTGRKPFDSDNPVAIAVMHMHDIPERPRAINPDIPDGLEEIVLRAMEKAPEDRYQTTAEMISDIEAFKADPHITFGYYTEDDEDANDEILDQSAGTEVQSESRQEVANAYAAKAASAAGAGAGAGAAAMSAGGGSSAGAVSQRYNDAYPENYDEDYDDEDDEEEEERSSLVVPVLTAVVVVVIIVAVIFVVTLLSGLLKNGGSRGDKSMPDLYGWDYQQALSAYGNTIKFEVEGTEYNEADPNTIIKQSIEPGDVFSKGDVCKVTLSMGMETVEVPRVKDLNVELAKAQLTERGIVADIRKQSDANVKPNYVIKSEPEEGTEVHKGSTVILYVSMGANAEQFEMEDYVGLTIDDATMRAGYKNLKVETELIPSYEKKDKVVDQDPPKGTKIEGGSSIKLYVSDGTIPDGKVDITIPLPSDANGRFSIDFILTDEKGKTTAQSSGNIICPDMSSVPMTLDGSGKNVSVRARLTNLSTQQNAVLGTYTFNFATGKYTTESEDIYGAFQAVNGFPQPETDPPTDPPQPEHTEPPVEQPTANPDWQPGFNGEYVNGEWVPYEAGVNGNWETNEDGSTTWHWWN